MTTDRLYNELKYYQNRFVTIIFDSGVTKEGVLELESGIFWLVGRFVNMMLDPSQLEHITVDHNNSHKINITVEEKS